MIALGTATPLDVMTPSRSDGSRISGGLARIPPLHRLQQRLPHARKHVHVLVAVDVVGRSAHARLEAVELAADLGPDLVAVEQAEQGPRHQAAQAWELAGGRQPRHRPERGAERQVEVQPDAQVAAVHAQARRAGRPMRGRDQHAGRRQALGRGELADGAGNALGQRVVVGAEDDHALEAALST